MIKLEVKMEALKTLQDMPKKVFSTPLMREIGTYMVSSTQRKITSNIPPANAPLTQAVKQSNLTLRDTGRLLSSITYLAYPHQVIVGTNLIYAPIQQLGGTIKPRKAKKLWIPAGAHTRKLLRRYGTPQGVIEGLRAVGYRVWISKSKRAVLYAKKGGSPQVLFILKDQVDIPARPFLRVDEKDEKIVPEIVKDFVLRAV
ncbi:MAG: phage virion morphogenesis protein [Ignisphaera sp.]